MKCQNPGCKQAAVFLLSWQKELGKRDSARRCKQCWPALVQALRDRGVDPASITFKATGESGGR